MTEDKKEWVTPELIVLVRHKPEEAVLITCKQSGSGADINNSDGGCRMPSCTWCAVSASS